MFREGVFLNNYVSFLLFGKSFFRGDFVVVFGRGVCCFVKIKVKSIFCFGEKFFFFKVWRRKSSFFF